MPILNWDEIENHMLGSDEESPGYVIDEDETEYRHRILDEREERRKELRVSVRKVIKKAAYQNYFDKRELMALLVAVERELEESPPPSGMRSQAE